MQENINHFEVNFEEEFLGLPPDNIVPFFPPNSSEASSCHRSPSLLEMLIAFDGRTDLLCSQLVHWLICVEV